jgi:uncharacterized Zn-binding protein involved in type VI secretion
MPGVARIGDTIDHGGAITGGSSDVIANGLGVARVGDAVLCDEHGIQAITGGSATVITNGKGTARIGDGISCGATIVTGSSDVIAG